MKIVGGTYGEFVLQPEASDLMGSGMRAAAALANTDVSVALVTAIEESDRNRDEADLVAEALRVADREVLPRSEAVSFRYVTPISAPSINGVGSRIPYGVDVADDTVLIFGMTETGALAEKVEARTVVIDPQKPRDTEPLVIDHIFSDRLVIVANRSETTQLGRSSNLSVAAAALLYETAATAVITKRGAAGCLVTWGSGEQIRHEIVSAFPTTRVWPIGSGDTFSAGLTYALNQGADVVEAARVGSAAAAHWCSTRRPDLPTSLLKGDELWPPIQPRPGRVYLAGPFFTTGERWLIETVYEELQSLGVEVWSPVHEVGHGEDIALADLEGLRSCDAVLALLDHSDSGTIFEVGWAVGWGIPTVGFGTVVEREGMKMLSGSAVELHRDLSTACYRAAWAAMGMRPTPGWMTI